MLNIDQAITLFINGSHSLFIDGMALTATHTSTWIPLMIVLLYTIIQGNNLRGVFLFIIAFALCILISDQMASTICKPLFERWRPTHDPEIMYLVDTVNGYRGGKYGFFSSHAANTMSIAVFLSLVLKHKRLSIWLFSWVALNCWTRVYLGVHYVGDITVGLIWGTIVGYVIHKCYNHYLLKSEVDTIAATPSPTPALSFYSSRNINLLITTIQLTYLYVLIRALFFI